MSMVKHRAPKGVSRTATPSATQRFIDALATRVYRLPPRRGSYTVTRAIPVRMRDGVELLTDHYAPTGQALGTVFMRSPYRRSGLLFQPITGLFASRGYHFVLQSCRGTFGSGGHFEFGADEVDDGADAVAWLREQPWFEARLVALGGSYTAFTTWAWLMQPPPELVAVFVFASIHDSFEGAHGTGAFHLQEQVTIADGMSRQQGQNVLNMVVDLFRSKRRLQRAFDTLPMADAVERIGAHSATWFRDSASRTERDDPYWTRRDCGPALDEVNVPVKILAGWQDPLLDQSLQAYERLRDRGVEVALTVGPWTHLMFLTKAASRLLNDALDWTDGHVTGKPPEGTGVSYYVVGADEWRSASSWPPPSQPSTLYLGPGGRLVPTPPESSDPAQFTYDPRDPTPTVGGRLLSTEAGYRDDTELSKRHDLCVFTTQPLPQPLDVVGVPTVSLAHESDNPHCDIWVRVSEVDRLGRSRNVTDGYQAVPSASVNGTITLGLDPTAHRFGAGSRVRVLVGGGSYPRFARNLGTGENRATGTSMVPSRRTIHLAEGASTVTLPVVDTTPLHT